MVKKKDKSNKEVDESSNMSETVMEEKPEGIAIGEPTKKDMPSDFFEGVPEFNKKEEVKPPVKMALLVDGSVESVYMITKMFRTEDYTKQFEFHAYAYEAPQYKFTDAQRERIKKALALCKDTGSLQVKSKEEIGAFLEATDLLGSICIDENIQFIAFPITNDRINGAYHNVFSSHIKEILDSKAVYKEVDGKQEEEKFVRPFFPETNRDLLTMKAEKLNCELQAFENYFPPDPPA